MLEATNDLVNFARGAQDSEAMLPALRASARARLGTLRWPSPRSEDWKNTNVAALTAQTFATVATPVTGSPLSQTGLLVDSPSLRLVFVDGHFDAAASTLQALPADAWVGSLRDGWRLHGARISAHLEGAVAQTKSAFGTLNAALMQDGGCVLVPRGVTLAQPIELVFVSRPGATPHMAHLRNLIVVEDGGAVDVLETYVAQGQGVYFTNTCTDVVLGANAALNHVRFQDESETAYHIATLQATLPRDSRLRAHVVSQGAALSRQEFQITLAGPGAHAAIGGLALGHGTQHTDHNVMMNHATPHGTSTQLFKGIFEGHATGVFGGKVVVQPHALKTDAKQLNKNLLLSAQATAHTRPQLEILADDVKCSHGATVGQLDEEALFYLRSRGLDPAVARELLTYAFASDVLAELSSPAIRQALTARLGRLQHAVSLGGDAS